MKENTTEKVFTGKDLLDLGINSLAVQVMIKRNVLSTVPRLSYKNGWMAEYWYCSGNVQCIDYYAKLRVPSGLPMEVRQVNRYTECEKGDQEIELALSPESLLAKKYLEYCAELIQKGEPAEEALLELKDRWSNVVPDFVKDAAYQKDNLNPQTINEPQCDGFPWPPTALPQKSESYWTWERVKKVLLDRIGKSEEEIYERIEKEKRGEWPL